MRRSLDVVLLVGVGLMMVLLATGAAINYRNIRQLQRVNSWVAQTHRVRELTSDTLRLLLEASEGQEEFIASGQNGLLQAYEGAEHQIDTKLYLLKKWTEDNQLQRQRVAALERECRSLLSELARGIDLHLDDAADAPKLASADAVQRHLGAIRAIAADIAAEEAQLLEQRERQSSGAYQFAVFGAIATVPLGIGLFVATVEFVRRWRRDRAQSSAALLAQQRSNQEQITQRVRTQQELADSQRFFRSVLDALSSHIAVLDDDGVILTVNDAWREFSDAGSSGTARCAVGDNYLVACQQAFDGDAEGTRESTDAIRDVIEGKRPMYVAEYPCYAPSGKRWFQLRVNRFSGQAMGRVVIAREEITHRVLSEESVRHRSQQIQSLADIALQLNAVQDLPSLLRVVTTGARATVGAHQAITSRIADHDWANAINIVSFSEKYAAWRNYESPLDGTGIYSVVSRSNHPLRLNQEELESHPRFRDFGREADKHPPLRGWLAAPLVTSDGRNAGLIQLSDKYEGDFTKEDEAVLVQLAQMASRAIENALLYQELRESDRRKDQFLATLAHELRNPLWSLTSAVQLISLEPACSSQVGDLAGVAARQCEQLKRLIDDLLDVSRIATGKLCLHREIVELNEAVRTALDTCRPLIEANSHALEVSLPDEHWAVAGDPVRLAQIVANLLTNAAKYTPAGGRLRLSVTAVDDWAVVQVEDNGIGIPAEMQHQIFELFTQVDSSYTRTQGGLGIGLTLVKTLVELHGGSVQLTSAGMNKGSRFVVRLPLAQIADESDQPSLSIDEGPIPPVRRFRIMVVDDNRPASFLLSRLLEKLSQTVCAVDSASRALAQLPEFSPHIVISDIAMPGMSGYELAAAIRQLSLDRPPMLVALTGYGQKADRDDALAAGFDEHLVKPIGLTALVDLLGAASSHLNDVATTNRSHE